MAQLYRDFMRGALSAGIDGSELTLASSAFVDLPVVSGGDELWITLDPDGLAGDPEIVRVDAHSLSATSLTVSERGVNSSTPGTSAGRSHEAGTLWTAGFHAQGIGALETAVAFAQGTADAALPAAGGTVSGDLAVSGATTVAAPSSDLHASTKKYVDDEVGAISVPDTSPLPLGIISHTYSATAVTGITAASGAKQMVASPSFTAVADRYYRIYFEVVEALGTAGGQRLNLQRRIDGGSWTTQAFAQQYPAATGVATTVRGLHVEVPGAGTVEYRVMLAEWYGGTHRGNDSSITIEDIGQDPNA